MTWSPATPPLDGETDDEDDEDEVEKGANEGPTPARPLLAYCCCSLHVILPVDKKMGQGGKGGRGYNIRKMLIRFI